MEDEPSTFKCWCVVSRELIECRGLFLSHGCDQIVSWRRNTFAPEGVQFSEAVRQPLGDTSLAQALGKGPERNVHILDGHPKGGG